MRASDFDKTPSHIQLTPDWFEQRAGRWPLRLYKWAQIPQRMWLPQTGPATHMQTTEAPTQ